jgi:hypothetical protein
VLARTADEDVHTLQVWPLDALGLDVRVADSVSHLSLLATNFTLRWHGFSEGG